MFWPMLAIALGFLGLAVLGVLAVRVFTELRRLSAQVAESSRRIGVAAGELERSADGLARTGGALR
ncbi:hypothetical protein ACIQM4_30715 [Streptomyces sp. NPDC091272]|uniref:hypothetical protein n=1 Tax=Streptomyces sp. NPDC091272 TaxID=3365981 RepID=UPI0037F255DF